MRNTYRILDGKFEGKRLLGRRGHRWKGNIRLDLREIGREDGVQAHSSVRDPVMGCCEHGNEPSGL